MKRFLCLGAALALFAILPGCGGVFRPIIIPNPPQFPNPAAAHTVLTLSDNGTSVSGSAMVIDVSGDTDVGQQTVGLRPVHAVQQSALKVLIANQSVPGAGQDSLTSINFSGVAIASAATLSLPAGSAPNFVATTEANQAYVSLPGYAPPSVAVINTSLNSIAATIPVGLNPSSIAETPDTKKLYVANAGDPATQSTWTISAFNTTARSARTVCDSTGTVCPPTLSSQPIWLAARSDSQRVFLLESNGTLAYLNTTTTSGPDLLTETSIVVPPVTPATSAYMWYDVILNRLYIPSGQQLVIVDASQSAPTTLATVPISIVSPASRAATDPCSTTTPGTLVVTSATSLPDGSRAYVGGYYIDSADNLCPQVTVIDAKSYGVKTNIAIPGVPDATNPATEYYVPVCAPVRFRLNMAAGGDSSRAYLATCDGGAVNIVNTATDTYYFSLPAPFSVRPPLPGSKENPPQNPTFLLAGP